MKIIKLSAFERLKYYLMDKLYPKPKITSKDDIQKSKYFCILPWIHLHIQPDSNVQPCCISEYGDHFGNLKENSIEEVWNNKKYNKMRRLMIEDRPHYGCSTCYELESNGIASSRINSNIRHRNSFDLLHKTLPDGKMKQLEMRYFDVRFSNICNFKCRGCNPESSTSWYSDWIKLTDAHDKKKRVNHIEANTWKDLEDYIEDIEVAYFAGGEPLLMEEHYLTLQKMIDKNMTHVHLMYTTNLSQLQFGKYDLIELWSHFKSAFISISIDDTGTRGEYFRSGSNWKQTLENIKFISNKFPHFGININCTISLFNIHRIPEIHNFLFENNFINATSFIFNNLMYPEDYRTQVLPHDHKTFVEKKLKDYIKFLKATKPEHNWSDLNFKINQQIEFMFSKDLSNLLHSFQYKTNKLDELRNESFTEVYPELKELMN
jgi:radical SAM protein with 4Fe4S-binding SPASM domain